MKNQVAEILSDIEAVLPAEALLLSQKNPAIRILNEEIEELLKQLRIVEKVGAIDDIAEREGPVLCDSIRRKSAELHQLVSYEKSKEKRREFYKVDAAEFEVKPQTSSAREGVSSTAQAQMNNIYIARQAAQAIDNKINVMAKLNRSYADSNLHVVGAVGAILIAIQLIFNFTFENRLKATAREAVVQNLEERLKLAEQKNNQLSGSLAQLHREVAFQRSVNLRMPQLASSKKGAASVHKRNQNYRYRVSSGKQTQKTSSKSRYMSSQSNYGRR